MIISFEIPLEFRERAQAIALELTDPALGDLVDGYWIDEMQLLAALAFDRHEVGLLKNGQMLGHRLAGHIEAQAELAQCLAVFAVQPIQQLTTAGICQSFEN